MRSMLASLVLASTLTGQADLYDVDTFRTFYFSFPSANWHAELTQARATNTNVKGNLIVDNVTYTDVGVRFRGSSSFLAVGTKKSLNVTMDAFVPGQELLGYDSLNLSNGYNDPSLCREVVSFGILRQFMPAPQANYVKVYVNNTYFGLFVNVQQPDGKFIKEWYKGNAGNRYRCDPPTAAGRGRSALQWLGTTLQNYIDAYELKNNPQTAVQPWEDVRELCDVLNNTSNAQLETELPKVLNVDQALWYLALNNVMVNLDSYVSRGNDYYMYHDTKHDTMGLLPWDMNESFGGFSDNMTIPQLLALNPYFNQSTPFRPLLGKLFNVVPEWRKRYFHHVREIIDTQFNWRVVGPLVTKYQGMIDAAVQADPNLLYTYQMFKDNVTSSMFVNSSVYRTEIPGLQQMCDGREAYIKSLNDYKLARPDISNVIVPTSPKPNTVVTITASVTSTVPMGTVILYYRDTGTWQTAEMFDDGNHGDGLANDGVFGGFVPATTQQPTRKIHYYIGARTAVAAGEAANYFPSTAAFDPPDYTVDFAVGTSPISINEVVAINNTGVVDEKLQHEDWLELHNSSAGPVSIGGMFLTDDLLKPTQWEIPAAYAIPAGESLLIWCDNDPGDGPLHATFKLAGAGEKVWLFDLDGKTILSTLEFGQQIADISNGWLFDGGAAPLVAYKVPTPHKPNSEPCSSRQYWPLDHAAHRLGLEFAGSPKIGVSGTSIRVTNGPVSSGVALFISTAGGVLPFGAGLHLMLTGSLHGPYNLPTDATGSANIPLTVPNSPALKGTSVYLQAGGTDAIGFTVSNGVEVRICN